MEMSSNLSYLSFRGDLLASWVLLGDLDLLVRGSGLFLSRLGGAGEVFLRLGLTLLLTGDLLLLLPDL